MKLRGQIYIGSLLLLAVLFLLRSDLLTMPTSAQLASLFVLLSMATVSQFFEVRFHDGRIYYPHSVFFFAAVLLLPPFLLLPLFAIPLWLALLRTNREESYAISTYRDLLLSVTIQLLIGSSAHWLYFALNSHLNEMVEIGQVFAALVAASVYVMGNHTLFRLADISIVWWPMRWRVRAKPNAHFRSLWLTSIFSAGSTITMDIWLAIWCLSASVGSSSGRCAMKMP